MATESKIQWLFLFSSHLTNSLLNDLKSSLRDEYLLLVRHISNIAYSNYYYCLIKAIKVKKN